jgi:hypothetical protein
VRLVSRYLAEIYTSRAAEKPPKSLAMLSVAPLNYRVADAGVSNPTSQIKRLGRLGASRINTSYVLDERRPVTLCFAKEPTGV